jgi:predicted solute-binding protein
VLVRLNNIVLESSDVYALYTDLTTKKRVHSVYVRDKMFQLTEEEYVALETFLKVKVLVKEESEDVES